MPFLALLLTTAATSQDAIALDTHRDVLANGLTVIIAPDPSASLVSVRLFYKVGSRNEHAGITGIAHLFEHMMFNGTDAFGPKQFDRVLERAGGAGNAFTTRDFTCYMTTVPSESLDTVLALEADRMTGLRLDDKILQNEIRVVLEERREVLEDKAIESTRVVFLSSLFQAHPYRWPVLGWRSDIESIDVEACRSFYRTYYAPNNAVLVLAGAVEVEAALERIRARFGPVPRGPAIPAPHTAEPEHRHASRVRVTRAAPNPLLLIGFIGPRARDDDHAVLDLIHEIISRGPTARLYRRLVLEEQVATGVDLKHDWMIEPEPLYIEVSLPPKGDVARAEELVFEELNRLIDEAVPPDELRRAIVSRTAFFVRYGLVSPMDRAMLLGRSEVLVGDHRRIAELPAIWRNVAPERIREVARRYFVRARAVTTVLAPEAGR